MLSSARPYRHKVAPDPGPRGQRAGPLALLGSQALGPRAAQGRHQLAHFVAGGPLGQVAIALERPAADHVEVVGGTAPGHAGIAGLSVERLAAEEEGPVHRGTLALVEDERNAKLVFGAVLHRNAFGLDLYRRPRPPWQGLGGHSV